MGLFFTPLNPPLTDWRGKTVWLIGASSGIGEATAAALHAAGARVVVSARRADALTGFTRAHPGSLAIPLDVTDAAAVQQACEQVLSLGPLDCVVYCSGIYTPTRAFALDAADAQRHMDVNYNGAVRLLASVLPAMLAQGHGHISLVSSVAGYRGLTNGLVYGPTKAALTHLAEGLYLDLHAKGLGVSVISPGFVETPATAVNDFEMPALITAAQAAQHMLAGWAAGDFEIHFPKRFTRFMQLLRILPDRLYFALVKRITQ
ncbi:MAG: SDR family NAD(P)-dependent oxidoreductase [Betaproteobacteria bacterium]|nr:SDR family NAD(P)-dependent oxidoreductase [Betaproteobacteria bacterium]